MTSWRAALAVYADRRVLSILFLGFSSGLPLALTGATLAVWLTESGVPLAGVGLFALVGLPYTLKFIWAPLFDRAPLPPLTSWLGRRRGWLVAIQAVLILSLLGLGGLDPAAQPVAVAVLALVVAFCSASQDIVVDAYRVEILREEQYGAGAAMVQFGYRLAMLCSGAGALLLAALLPWSQVYAVMAALIGVGIAAALVNPEPPRPVPPAGGGVVAGAMIEPFAEMIRRQGWALLPILAFVLFFKLGDALAGVMANPFYVRMGFSKVEIAEISKLFGFGATLLGVFLGGLLVARVGIWRSLLLCGVLQAASNLMFALQAMAGHDLALLTLTIAVENLSGGMGSAAFVAYISRLCSLNYTGTQYALLSSLAAVGRTGLAASGGFLVEMVGWVDFFLLSTVAALPGLMLLMVIGRMERPRASDGPAVRDQTLLQP